PSEKPVNGILLSSSGVLESSSSMPETSTQALTEDTTLSPRETQPVLPSVSPPPSEDPVGSQTQFLEAETTHAPKVSEMLSEQPAIPIQPPISDLRTSSQPGAVSSDASLTPAGDEEEQ